MDFAMAVTCHEEGSSPGRHHGSATVRQTTARVLRSWSPYSYSPRPLPTTPFTTHHRLRDLRQQNYPLPVLEAAMEEWVGPSSSLLASGGRPAL